MKTAPHRITYTTPKGDIKNNILIEAESREEAENEFRRDWPKMVVYPTDPQFQLADNLLCV